MKHLTKPLTFLAVVVTASTMATAAWAYWTSTGTGSASAMVGTLSGPTGVSASWSGTNGKVSVGWNAVASPDGVGSHVGYYVQRGTTTVCGSPTLLTSTTTTCDDLDVPRGSHNYTVTAVFRTWTASTPTTAPVAVVPNVAITAGQSVPTGGTISASLHGFQASDTITFKLDNASGSAITSPASVSTPAGSGSATATLTIPAGASAGTHAIHASGLGGAADSATSANTFTIIATASKFAFTSSAVSGQASISSTLGPITIQAQDASGNPVNVTSATTVNLASNSAGTAIFSLTSGGTTVSAVTIPSGSSSATFFYGDTRAGTPSITASGTLTSATQTETITAGTVAGLAFTNANRTVSCGTISSNYSCTVSGVPINGSVTANVGFVDRFGNSAVQSATATSTISLSSPAKGNVTPGSLSIAQNTSTSTTTFTLSKQGSNAASTTASFDSFSVTLTTN